MKYIAFFNVLGILALAGLCAFQWEKDRKNSLELVSLDKTRQEREKAIGERDGTIKDYVADLEGFRARLQRQDAILRHGEIHISTLLAEGDRAAADRDRAVSERIVATDALKQSQETLAKWVVAAHERDETIKKAIATINTLAKERNDTIAKFNDLAGKYNALVKEASKASAER